MNTAGTEATQWMVGAWVPIRSMMAGVRVVVGATDGDNKLKNLAVWPTVGEPSSKRWMVGNNQPLEGFVPTYVFVLPPIGGIGKDMNPGWKDLLGSEDVPTGFIPVGSTDGWGWNDLLAWARWDNERWVMKNGEPVSFYPTCWYDVPDLIVPMGKKARSEGEGGGGGKPIATVKPAPAQLPPAIVRTAAPASHLKSAILSSLDNDDNYPLEPIDFSEPPSEPPSDASRKINALFDDLDRRLAEEPVEAIRPTPRQPALPPALRSQARQGQRVVGNGRPN